MPSSNASAGFTATSATCVTGLVVRDTGRDFSLMGQVVILGLIQLGGLGIVIFGAVFSLIKGLDFEEAIILLLAAGALATSHRYFRPS